MITITRPKLCKMIGISRNKLSEIIRHHKHLNFPAPVNTVFNQQLYDQDAVLKWAAETDYHNIKWTQAPKPVVVASDCRFDNALATQFVTRPKSGLTNVANKHIKRGATTTVHCIERFESSARNEPMYKRASNYTIYLDRSF